MAVVAFVVGGGVSVVVVVRGESGLTGVAAWKCVEWCSVLACECCQLPDLSVRACLCTELRVDEREMAQ